MNKFPICNIEKIIKFAYTSIVYKLIVEIIILNLMLVME